MFLAVASASDNSEFDAAGSPTSRSELGFDLVSAAASPASPPPPPPQLAAVSTSAAQRERATSGRTAARAPTDSESDPRLGSSAGKAKDGKGKGKEEKGERRQFAAISRPQVSLAEAVLSAGKSADTLAQLGLLYQIRGDFEVRSFSTLI